MFVSRGEREEAGCRDLRLRPRPSPSPQPTAELRLTMQDNELEPSVVGSNPMHTLYVASRSSSSPPTPLSPIESDDKKKGESPALSSSIGPEEPAPLSSIEGGGKEGDSPSPISARNDGSERSSHSDIGHLAHQDVTMAVPNNTQVSTNDGRGATTLGGSLMIVLATARLRRAVRDGHERLAKRIGTGLLLCSVGHIVVLLTVMMEGGSSLSSQLTVAVSASCFLLHLCLTLSYKDTRLLWLHFCTHTSDAFIRGVAYVAQGDLTWGMYHLVVWSSFAYPVGGFTMHRFLKHTRELSAEMRDAAARNAVFAFTGAAFPVLYFLLNGLLCLSFAPSPEHHCATRVAVNYTTIFACTGNAMAFVMMAMRPISLIQITRLSLPLSQRIGLVSQGLLLAFTTIVHSQNERFKRTTPAIDVLAALTPTSLLLSLLMFSYSIIERSAECSTGVSNPPEVVIHYGNMITYRVLMVCFTILYLTIEIYHLFHIDALWDYFTAPITTLSFAAAALHLWMSHGSMRVARCHWFGHCLAILIRASRQVRQGEKLLGVLFNTLVYVVGIFPIGWMALTKFWVSVRTHSAAAAAECVAATFRTFWLGIVPSILYLGSDSYGEV